LKDKPASDSSPNYSGKFRKVEPSGQRGTNPSLPRSSSSQSILDQSVENSAQSTPIGTSAPNTPSNGAQKKLSLSEYSMKRSQQNSTTPISQHQHSEATVPSQQKSNPTEIPKSSRSSNSNGNVSNWNQAMKIHEHVAEELAQTVGSVNKLSGKERWKWLCHNFAILLCSVMEVSQALPVSPWF
jgi:hypothetical protein